MIHGLGMRMKSYGYFFSWVFSFLFLSSLKDSRFVYIRFMKDDRHIRMSVLVENFTYAG